MYVSIMNLLFSVFVCWLFCVLCLYICKFSQIFIMVPLCGICFISVILVMSGNSCPVFIACVAKLKLYISRYCMRLGVQNNVFSAVFLFVQCNIYCNLDIQFSIHHWLYTKLEIGFLDVYKRQPLTPNQMIPLKKV